MTVDGGSASLFATVALAHALAVMSPGPDLAVVIRQTLAHGRRAGVMTAVGIASGIAFHVAYSLFGLGWALTRMPALLAVLQALGAGLLLWLGWGALQARPPAHPPSAGARRVEPHAPAARSSYRIGLATNLLNVKAMLFFVALCSAVITGSTGTALKLGLGAWMIVTTGLWFSAVAWTLGHPQLRQRLLGIGHWIDRTMGVLLIGIALAMLARLLGGV